MWGLDGSGVTTWTEVPFDLNPNDFAGLVTIWPRYSTVRNPNTLPSCAALFGSNPTGEETAELAYWSWPPTNAGDIATTTEFELPTLPSSGAGVVIDLDPTVEGNGYNPVRTGLPVWQYGVYRGSETLTCDNARCNKVYWNTAVGFDPTVADCRLVMQATAAAAPGLVNGVTPGGVYPVITFDVPLTALVDGKVEVVCEQDPLDGDGSGVTTGYTDFGEPIQFCYRFDGTVATSLEDCEWTSPGGGGGGGDPIPECVNGDDCYDGLICTDDVCKGGFCSYNPLPGCTEPIPPQ